MNREDFISFDGKKLSLCVWDDVEKNLAKAVVLVAHGMAEDIKRYDTLARFLNFHGFIVAGEDHRAHGLSADEGTHGHSEGDVFCNSVEDMRAISMHLRERFALPIIFLGHSYGSFLAQRLVCEGWTEGFKGVILSGSAFMKGAVLSFGHLLAKSKVRRGKAHEGGHTFAKLTFHSYDKKIKEGKNGWLSYDKSNVEKYNEDPMCGFLCSNNFYYSFFKGLKATAASNFKSADKTLPLYLISGQEDPVGGNGKLVKKLEKNYINHGFAPKFKLYDNMRHEILNEEKKDVVFSDILDFCNSCLKAKE